jgi:hypothetical protein
MRQTPRFWTSHDPAGLYHEPELEDTWEKTANKETLVNILSIYKYNFLSDKTEQFVKKIWKTPHGFAKIHNSARLIVNKNLNKDEIKTHLSMRHPIHINGPQYKDIHHTKLFNILHLTQSEIEKIPENVWMRYGILAQTPILQNSDTIDVKKVWVLHTWGCNLETLDTTDAKYVFQSGEFSQIRYLKVMHTMFDIFENACLHVHKETNRNVVLRVTKLGFGAWLNEMPNCFIPLMKRKYEEFLFALTQKYKWLEIRHPIYPNHQTFGSFSKSKWELLERNHDPFGKPKFVHDNDYVEIPIDSELIIVNAWDDRSFIGNGGSRDNSLDGWLVAGPCSGFPKSEFDLIMGANMINASYLHNVFFCTNLLKPSNWVTF